MSRRITQLCAWSVYIMVCALYIFSLSMLFQYRGNEETFWSFAEVVGILKYSFWQAALSAMFSTIFGLLLARGFFYLTFIGKGICYKLVSFAWSLPSLVVIFAVIGVWGNSGWLAQIASFLGLNWHFQLYGLQGILIAHLLFNIPLVTKYCLGSLRLIPSSQHQLAAQLNIKGWHYFRLVELPVLKGILPYAFVHIFLICFTSFPIVLMLGGGPKYSTLEVAIYQAVTFEFDFAKAVMLIITQFLIGIGLQIAMSMAMRRAFIQNLVQAPPMDQIWKSKPTGVGKWGLQAVTWSLIFTIIVPMWSVVWSGLSVPDMFTRLLNPLLWEATLFSIMLSVIASVTVITVAYVIALEARQLAYRGHQFAHSILSGIVIYPLILPVFLLAVGLFLWLIDVELARWQLLLLVGGCNGLVLLPYIYRIWFSAMWQVWVSQDKLAKSLGLYGFRRWWIVEKNYLARPLRNAFSLAMSSSLGSFAVIVFLGSPDFSSLPYLLYQQMGSYRMDDAAVTALVLMLLAFLPFLFIEQNEN